MDKIQGPKSVRTSSSPSSPVLPAGRSSSGRSAGRAPFPSPSRSLFLPILRVAFCGGEASKSGLEWRIVQAAEWSGNIPAKLREAGRGGVVTGEERRMQRFSSRPGAGEWESERVGASARQKIAASQTLAKILSQQLFFFLFSTIHGLSLGPRPGLNCAASHRLNPAPASQIARLVTRGSDGQPKARPH